VGAGIITHNAALLNVNSSMGTKQFVAPECFGSRVDQQNNMGAGIITHNAVLREPAFQTEAMTKEHKNPVRTLF